MYSVILGPRELHHVQTPEAYRQLHAKTIAQRRARGQRVQVHQAGTSKAARIDLGNWIIDCECGAGVATDPEWGVACCFGCGAVHSRIVFPDDRAAIEALILKRPNQLNRFWRPGETVAQIQADNDAHGVK